MSIEILAKEPEGYFEKLHKYSIDLLRCRRHGALNISTIVTHYTTEGRRKKKEQIFYGQADRNF